MTRFSFLFFAAFTSTIMLTSCNRNSPPAGDNSRNGSDKGQTASAPCVIYKTRADYRKNVPVALSDDKSKIVSYPGIKDMFINGEPAYPVPLENGYLLDNRGIGPDVAFLSFTYEEYAKLETTPSPLELFEKILDKDPLTEMYQCGNRSDYKEIVADLNRIISEDGLKAFKKLK